MEDRLRSWIALAVAGSLAAAMLSYLFGARIGARPANAIETHAEMHLVPPVHLRLAPAPEPPSSPSDRPDGALQARHGFEADLAKTVIPAIQEQLRRQDAAEEAECVARLKTLHRGFLAYQATHGRLPQASGVEFARQLISSGAIENTRENALALTCPASRPGAKQSRMPWNEWWIGDHPVDGNWSGYAFRDNEHFPLFRLSALEPMAACDNSGGGNHRDLTHVLYGSGAVLTLSRTALRQRGWVQGHIDPLTCGWAAIVPDLRKLTAD